LKYFVVLSVLGVAASLSIPPQAAKDTNRKSSEISSDLESSFSSGDAESSSNLSRDKRHLLFKKLNEHGGSDTVYVNRRYEGSSSVGYQPPRREVHHHHHYSYPPPQQSYQQYPAPSNEYHHYHGASSGYQQQGYGSSYQNGGYVAASSGNYYSPPNYGDGGYAHYGSYGGQPQQISSAPVATAQNKVDRGQGAAAVNNIAIINARAGSSNNLVESESKILPRPLPVDVEDALNNWTQEE